MIIWQSGSGAVDTGQLETRRCDACGQVQPFRNILQYRYWGVYWIFNMVTKKQYFQICQGCQTGKEIEAGDGYSSADQSAIPFMHRFGLAMLAAVAVPLILVAIYSADQPSHRTDPAAEYSFFPEPVVVDTNAIDTSQWNFAILRCNSDVGEKVNLSMIVVKDYPLAEQILAKSRAGEPFADLALEFSLHPSSKLGGNIGEFRLSDLNKEFQNALQGLEQSDYTSIIQLNR